MLDWMSPLAFAQTLIRVAVVWAAFYFAGHLLIGRSFLRKSFPLLPKELAGAVSFLLLVIPLSLLRVLDRTVCPIVLVLFSIPGFFLIFHKMKERAPTQKPPVVQIIFSLVLLAVVFINLTNASSPNLNFDDPLITYAVQPDKWLNNGHMHWVEEAVHSGFPQTYEMIAVWPASLSSDRIDQISVLQVFQMSLLLVALLRGMQLVKIRNKLRIPLAITILMCSMLVYWCSLAKTDTMALL